ncbi:MAG: phosphoenolpyruvate--protein phosphotransferase [Candidatus Omnitrophica bacterium]|nr:phosphoenolpyruvate--protein phosphotransferase [Candidatus Omnitrophota bacterium]MBU4140961.1 phosphoenolpyruvate--protein phosphotransferase [Candidatus Omnitrophota bacterium]
MLKGIPAAPGLIVGKAFCLGSEDMQVQKRAISESQVPKEVTRFKEALIKTRAEILDIQKKISREMGVRHAQIFNAHLLVLEDRTLIEGVITRLKKERFCIEYIFLEVLKKYIKTFSHIDDPYLRERLSDIEDVGKRILRNLRGIRRDILTNLKEKLIIVAYDLSPSDTASMHKEKVIGFITDIGGKTSHTAIMAKALEIPAVVGLEEATAKIETGDNIIVDGTRGEVLVNPDRATLDKYKLQSEKLVRQELVLLKLRDLPAETPDGREVQLAANIELPEELASVVAHGARGIGLYRTEYFYMNRMDLPTEEEHFEAYKKVSQQVEPYSVVIRTLDLGGDKFLSQLDIPQEMNPYLGWRAIRFCLARPEIFKVQLRAILRASAYGKLKLMYPMISGIEELRQANRMLEQVKEELRRRKIPFDEDIEVGAMIEIPSAALTCDILAKEADFFSIGTNDLIQYSIAVDRVNEKIAYLYEPAHPAVLRLIKNVIDSGHKENVWVGMCGEMASEPAFALLLLGLGLDEFSVSPAAVPGIKRVIRSVTLKQAKDMAHKALTLTTGKEVEAFSKEKLKELVP